MPIPANLSALNTPDSEAARLYYRKDGRAVRVPEVQRKAETWGLSARVRAPMRPPTNALEALNCARSTPPSAPRYDLRKCAFRLWQAAGRQATDQVQAGLKATMKKRRTGCCRASSCPKHVVSHAHAHAIASQHDVHQRATADLSACKEHALQSHCGLEMRATCNLSVKY